MEGKAGYRATITMAGEYLSPASTRHRAMHFTFLIDSHSHSARGLSKISPPYGQGSVA